MPGLTIGSLAGFAGGSMRTCPSCQMNGVYWPSGTTPPMADCSSVGWVVWQLTF
jgi:hypothetical protein